jgi:hypothetical protein
MTNTNKLAKASLTFALPAVSGKDVAFEGVAMDLTSHWTASPLSLFNTAIRGVEADRHGITGCTIPRPTAESPSATVPAFSATALPRVGSSQAHLSAAFPEAAVICASSSDKWAFCDGGKAVNASTEVPQDKALEILGLGLVDGYVQLGAALVPIDDAAPLLSELAYARTLAASLSDAVVTDAVPDAFTVALAGLKRLSASDRAQAMGLVASTIADASAALQARYNGVLTSVIALGTPAPVSADARAAAVALVTEVANDLNTPHKHRRHEGQMGAVDPKVGTVVVSDAAFPAVAVTPMRSVCARANEDAAARGLDLHFKCISAAKHRHHHHRGHHRGHHDDGFVSGVFLEEEVTVGADAVTADDVRKYQIVLWGVITLIAVLYYAVYATMYMDIAQDPTLFGNLSPTWTKRS